ncbi:response regulator transcription factor [Lacrimispora celerecrescens]|uniref:response regulator transcription factor n=1 Tax=Lacrimispora celerecrescens TaxID=29354 RepID=UPI0016474053|nr:response regulator [Lacrimispora celerecrescens]
MYRIMIVDDEPLILAGVSSLLNWEEHQCKIVRKVTNGRQALAQMEALRPDIVITDIGMPVMDGISFMKASVERGYVASFILLSNLEEFTLVKEALRLGAVDYLVKLELDEKALLAALERAKDRCNLTHRRIGLMEGGEVTADERIQNYFRHILVCETDAHLDERLSLMIRERYPVLLLMVIQFNYKHEGFSEMFTMADQKRIITFAENIIHEMVKGFFDRCCLLKKEQKDFILVLSLEEMNDYKKSVEAMSIKFCKVIRDYFDIPVSITVSRPVREAEGVQDLLYQAMSTMNETYDNGSSTVVCYLENCKENFFHSSSFNVNFLKKELTGIIRQNDRDSFSNIMNQIIQLFAQCKPSRSQAVNACSKLYYYITFLLEEREDQRFPYILDVAGQLSRLSDLSAVIAWLERFRDQVAVALETYKESRKDKYIELVQEYIREHYREKITLNQMSALLNISQGHLSSVFKKQTGKNFSDYVSEVKIEKAKELIGTYQYMMYEISDMLGFDTQYYFSTVFKKITGHTPKEYESITIKKNSS